MWAYNEPLTIFSFLLFKFLLLFPNLTLPERTARHSAFIITSHSGNNQRQKDKNEAQQYYTLQCQNILPPQSTHSGADCSPPTSPITSPPQTMKFPPWIMKRISLTHVRCLSFTHLFLMLFLDCVSAPKCALSSFSHVDFSERPSQTVLFSSVL